MNHELFKKVVDNLHDGLYFVNTDRVITYWNKGAEIISGFRAEDVVGKKCADNILNHVDESGLNLCKYLCPLAATLLDGEPREAEVFMHHKEGHRIPISIRVNPMINSSGTIVGGFELFTDLSNKRATELRIKELEKLSYLDYLTRISNRAFAEKELFARIEEFRRYGVQFGILYIDIDFFKNFNDTYGHDTGDEVLKFVAETFSSNCRPFDLYSRWGGEEFLGIIRNVDEAGITVHGEKICQLVENSFIVNKDKQKLSVTISIGGTVIRPNDDVKSVVTRADKLQYISKEAGRNRFTFG